MMMEDTIRKHSISVAEVRGELGRVIAKKHLTQVQIKEDDQ